MSPRSLLTSALAAGLACLALGPAAAHAVAPLEFELRGIEHDRMLASGDEREVIRAEGEGASLVLRETVECGLRGAHCGQLHRGVAHGDCEESLVHGTLTARGGTLRLRGVGRVCAGLRDHERLWLLGHAGTGRLAGVHALLEVRVAKTVQGGGAGPGEVVSVDTIDLDTLGIDRDGDRRARAAQAGASQACVLCEFLVSVVHSGQREGVDQPDQHFSHMARTCMQMPEHWAAACEDLAEQYGERIISLASLGYDATAICVDALGFRDRETS